MDVFIRQFEQTTEIFQRLLDSEFAVESQFLGHVTDSWTGNATLFRARFTTKDENLSTVETATTDDTTQ